VLGDEIPSRHLCMAISNATYYEALVTDPSVPARLDVDADGYLNAPTGPGIALPGHLDYPPELRAYAQAA
jgi:hypothetical protein